MFPYLSYIATAGAIGYVTGLSGFLPGALFSNISAKMSKRFQGALMGFTGGLLVAFVCFEMLHHAFAYQNVYLGCAGILSGVIVSAFAEGKISRFIGKANLSSSQNYIKTAALLFLGIGIHNIPEGMAISAVFAADQSEGVKMAVIIAIHCFPEALAAAVPLVQAGKKKRTILLFALALALPMGIGSIMGAMLSGISPFFTGFLLSFAGGVMIYITCGEILPESKDIWHGRLSTIGACLGFIAGVMITA